MSCLPVNPFDLALTLGSAPSWTFTAEDDSTTPYLVVSLVGASIWFAVKAGPTDTDAAALIFASTANGKVVITNAAAGHFQVDLTETDTAPTAALRANATYFAYLKIQLATGETRVRSGWVSTTVEGISAP